MKTTDIDRDDARRTGTDLDGRLPYGHRQTLAEINRPFYIARRDAAYARILDIIGRELLPSSKQQRVQLYRICANLLAEALMGTRRSQVQSDSPVLHYLQLLEETVGACLEMVRHEVKLSREAQEFSAQISYESMQELQSATDVFSNSEMNIMDCIEGLLRFGTPIMEEDTRQVREHLNSGACQRYDRAFHEYTEVYATRKAAR